MWVITITVLAFLLLFAVLYGIYKFATRDKFISDDDD